MLIFLVNLSEEERKKKERKIIIIYKEKHSEAPYVIDVAVIF